MPIRNIVALILTLVSFGLLIPGLIKPILHLSADATVASQMADFHTTVINKSRSIIGTAKDLYQLNHFLVAALIVVFCIVIPVAKGILLCIGVSYRRPKVRRQIGIILSALGKWSMADVFLVAILLTWLATSGQSDHVRQSLTILGMRIPIEMGINITTEFGVGFWWFLSYCLVSLAAIQTATFGERE